MSRDTALAQHRISRLAACLPIHRAFGWLHLHQPQMLLWQLEMLAIPAPPFAETARATWFLQRFAALGLSNPHLDEEGNACAELPSATPGTNQPYIVLSAHLDTVFPPGTDTRSTQEGPRILAPGACDNAAGLTALLAIAAALRHAAINPPAPILFCANVGEEGEGDLRGIRHLLQRGSYRNRVAAVLVLEGSGTAAAVTSALGSRRFRVAITGPGGHSWSDAGVPNPIVLLSRALVVLADLPALHLNAQPRTTLSPGHISGGTSINSVPATATVLLDLRSTDPTQLDTQAAEIHRTFSSVVTKANATSVPPSPQSYRDQWIHLQIDQIGDRPAAQLPNDAPLLHTLRAVDRHLGLRTELRLASTDANLPLSLGIPAAALAAGGTGGGIHTLAEWYDPTGRETALRRILLALLDLAQNQPGP